MRVRTIPNASYNSEKAQRCKEYKSLIMHTQRPQYMPELDDGYPLALLKIANKPILAYQIEYLERHGQFDITVVTESRFFEKIERYLTKYFK